MKTKLVIIILLAICCASGAFAAVPNLTLPYQKTLTVAATTSTTATPVTFHFSLFDAEIDGTRYWEESQTINVTKTTRLISVTLGSTGFSPLNITDFNHQLWVQVELNGSPIGNRDKLVVAPYAIWSATSNVPGVAGPQGEKGDPGSPGPAGSIGLQGPAGPQGPQGVAGAQGPKGDTGPAGAAGPKGDTGATGATGPQGAVGLTGAQGAAGPQGVKGDIGPQGAQGVAGPQGPKGEAGATGAQGATGLKGDTGPQGAVGPQGIQGPAGPKGDTGLQGIQGVVGPQGAKGDTGATGPQGPVGLTGAQGQAGPQGAKGDTGLQGAQGLQGGAGPQGPTGATGAQGPAGSNGSNGSPGADGKTVLSGTVDPSAGTGNNGDFYINTVSNKIFGPKASGAWGDGVSLGEPAGSIRGQLTTCSGDVPSSQVYIPGHAFFIITGSTGNYVFDFVPPGTYDVVINAPPKPLTTLPLIQVKQGQHTIIPPFLLSDVSSDASNCGQCGNVCQFANAAAACTNGTCGMGACNAGWGSCDGAAANGCEVNLQTNPNNCGTCGKVCGFIVHGTSACMGGTCGIGTCNNGWGNCDGAVANGCETNVQTNLNNCGGCGKVCQPANATAVCMNSMCGIGACNTGYADCNQSAADGCESYLISDTSNCGGCGVVCPVAAHTTATCTNSTCGMGACNAGWGNCNGAAADGCETNLISDTSNCGVCGRVCPVAPHTSTAACTNGTCGVGVCNAGWGNCNGAAADGCEANLLTSVTNCGACGNVCSSANGTAVCMNSTCGIGACNQGYADCNQNTADGCESNLKSDNNNCGGCGVVCTNGKSCNAGNCI